MYNLSASHTRYRHPQQLAVVAALVVCFSIAAFGQRYSQTNLVSDLPGLAAVQDPNLVNPWGVAFNPTGPFWVADNGTGVSTLYTGAGTPFPTAAPLVVTIPPPEGSTGTAAPTGVIFNPTTNFLVGRDAPALFIFDTEDGTISGWNPTIDLHHAVLKVDNSVRDAVYKGLTLAHNSEGNFLYATNFHDNVIEVYDRKFQLVRVLRDAGVPENYAPFGIRNINGLIYVTFAQQDEARHDDVAGPEHGFVDVINPATNEIRRLISRQGLNSPWGLTLAPANFGRFSNALLVGNFGDGTISAYSPSGTFLGKVLDKNGRVLSINGLWSITFGNGGVAGQTNELFFAAGFDDEAHGLFGKLVAIQ